MARIRTFCLMVGFLLAPGLGLPGMLFAQERDSPPGGASVLDLGEEVLAESEEAPGLLPPPEPPVPSGPPGAPLMPGPGPESAGPMEGRRPPERRLFGQHQPRPTYESLPEEEKLRLEDFMRRHFPERFEELGRQDEETPEAFIRQVDRLLPQMLRLMRLEQESPETFPLVVEEFRISMEIRALASHVSRERGGKRDENRVRELRRLLMRRFDLRQQIHRIEVRRLEDRLAQARERLDRHAAEKEELINRELEETLAPPRAGPKKDRPPQERPAEPPGEAP
ncbi:MAG: hypothetical protein V2A79_20300 [Planctomycetota bacterium]